MIEIINIALNFGKNDIPVGRLLNMQKKIHFEYHNEFLNTNYNISPFRLAKRPGIQTFDASLFEGLPGVFNDSLPDGWGRLLLDRAARAHGTNPIDLTPLDRLAFVGQHGIGALTYEPQLDIPEPSSLKINLDRIATQASNILHENSTEVLDELMALNGSSAGARPKALIGLDSTKQKLIHGAGQLPQNYTAWIVKFANSMDSNEIGAIEYVYSQLASRAGINMPQTLLFPSKKNIGYFATRRFERDENKRLHAHTACGLLHSDFRTPSLDYKDLLLLTFELTKDMRQVEDMYRLAVFNVCSHNQDDHSKNFTFLMDAESNWQLSPAYDLVYSSGPNGEQSTTVLGQGRNISLEQLKKLAAQAKISEKKANAIIEQCLDSLSSWKKLAKEADISAATLKEINSKFTSK